MYTITKEFHFSAAHQLKGLSPSHPCMRLHGHNYRVRVQLASETLDDTGFVMDYGLLSPIKNFIDQTIDHQNLNDVFPGMQTSAENIAKALYDLFKPAFPLLDSVQVSETEKTWAAYGG